MKHFLLLFLLFFGSNLHSQITEKDTLLYSEALSIYLPEYTSKANKAFRQRKFEKGRKLFKALVKNKLTGRRIDNFRFRNLKGQEIRLNNFRKPVYLFSTASWCQPGKGEIPALNEMAKKYHQQINFVVLFWDKRKTAKKLAKQFSRHITIAFVDETKNKNPFVVKNLKHALGLPVIYFLSEEKMIKDIQRSLFHPFHTPAEDSFQMNYEAMEEGITKHLLKTEPTEVASKLVVSSL